MAQNHRARRRRESEVIIDKILDGTDGGRVDPAIAENLRQHMVRHAGEPDRALLAHLKDTMAGANMPMNAVFPEDGSRTSRHHRGASGKARSVSIGCWCFRGHSSKQSARAHTLPTVLPRS